MTNITKGRKNRIEKVQKLKEHVDESKSIIFADYHGMTATQMSDLRLKLKESGSKATVAKNTLMKIAIEDKIDLKDSILTVFSTKDAISGIKVLFDFAKNNGEKPVVKAGLVEGNVTTGEKLKILSELPSREELIARALGGLKSPLNGLVNTLSGVQKNFVSVISEIAKSKGGA